MKWTKKKTRWWIKEIEKRRNKNLARQRGTRGVDPKDEEVKIGRDAPSTGEDARDLGVDATGGESTETAKCHSWVLYRCCKLAFPYLPPFLSIRHCFPQEIGVWERTSHTQAHGPRLYREVSLPPGSCWAYLYGLINRRVHLFFFRFLAYSIFIHLNLNYVHFNKYLSIILNTRIYIYKFL